MNANGTYIFDMPIPSMKPPTRSVTDGKASMSVRASLGPEDSTDLERRIISMLRLAHPVSSRNRNRDSGVDLLHSSNGRLPEQSGTNLILMDGQGVFRAACSVRV